MVSVSYNTKQLQLSYDSTLLLNTDLCCGVLRIVQYQIFVDDVLTVELSNFFVSLLALTAIAIQI